MNNYDHYALYKRPGHRTVTIAMLKAHRLRMKNIRRAASGLAPKETYSEI